MSLSPFAIPFFSCVSPFYRCMRERFLLNASTSLSSFDFHLFFEILVEWENCVTLDHCFSLWRRHIPSRCSQDVLSLNILTFNVRGLKQR